MQKSLLEASDVIIMADIFRFFLNFCSLTENLKFGSANTLFDVSVFQYDQVISDKDYKSEAPYPASFVSHG